MDSEKNQGKMSVQQSHRLRTMAQYASGKVLDIGFADKPNPFLSGDVTGFDFQSVPCPVQIMLQ
jgi:hypothetical protein